MQFLHSLKLATRFLPNQIYQKGQISLTSKILRKTFNNMNNFSVTIENGVLNGSGGKLFFSFKKLILSSYFVSLSMTDHV